MENSIHNGENHICKDSPDVRFSKKEQSNDLDILWQASLLTPWKLFSEAREALLC